MEGLICPKKKGFLLEEWENSWKTAKPPIRYSQQKGSSFIGKTAYSFWKNPQLFDILRFRQIKKPGSEEMVSFGHEAIKQLFQEYVRLRHKEFQFISRTNE